MCFLIGAVTFDIHAKLHFDGVVITTSVRNLSQFAAT